MAAIDDLTTHRLQVALRALARQVHPVAAYFFGSRAEGRADSWSDYDLAVFIEGTENMDMPSLARL